MLRQKIIKVCGMCDADNIRAVEALDEIDLIGFIFYPHSPRYVAQVPDYLPVRARRVGVFVDENEDTVSDCIRRFRLDYVQLHGNESPASCRSLQGNGVKVIKSLPVSHAKDLEKAPLYEGACDYLLFDTRCTGYGGSGQRFDWNLLNLYHGNTPFLLSGGIGPQDVSELSAFQHPRFAGFDLNSRFEWQPGIKDVERLRIFLKAMTDTPG